MTNELSPEIFLQEAGEILADIENIVLDLEDRPDDPEILNRLFRSMHTIKGSGAMYGFDNISTFAHHVETVLDCVRNGQIPVTTVLVNLILSSRDYLYTLVDTPESVDAKKGKKLIGALNLMLPDEEETPGDSDDFFFDPPPAFNGKASAPADYGIKFKPAPMIMLTGTNPISLLDELRDLGTCDTSADASGVPYLENLNPEFCYLSWSIRLTTSQNRSAIEDVFIFVEDDSDIEIETLKAKPDSKGDNSVFSVKEALIPEDNPRAVSLTKGRIEKAAATDSNTKRNKTCKDPAAVGIDEKSASIRVSAGKLDALINLVGELLIVQEQLASMGHLLHDVDKIKLLKMVLNMLDRTVISTDDLKTRRTAILKKFDRSTEQLESFNILERLADGMIHPIETLNRLAPDLRDCALRMRMVPIGSLFGKFRRLVRDLSTDMGKEVDLVAEGGETELDIAMIERIGDSLIHLIRNSVDHGISDSETREKKGKSRRATIRLTARHRGHNVAIVVEDNGKGIDVDAVREKAIAQGVVSEDATISDKEALNLIFLPGFSTAKTLTTISGRGVGLDVVKRGIEAIGGSVRVDSRMNEYCRFTLSIPLTLAIVKGLMVEVSGNRYVMPLIQVSECFDLANEGLRKNKKRNIVTLGERMVPFVSLRDLFNIREKESSGEHLAVVDYEGAQVGVLVDRILGDIHTVIKPLDKNHQHNEVFSGATILGDGTVAMVLDVPGIIRAAGGENRLKKEDQYKCGKE